MGQIKSNFHAAPSAGFRPQRVRDPLHNLITFGNNEFESVLWNVVQTEPFQRLRRIKQLGFSDFVYPGATHSRFAHSLGVFHIARRLMKIVEVHLGQSRYLDSHAHAAVAAALVHDVGHGPFSHAFEKVGKKLKLKMARHENVSEAIIRDGAVAEELNKLGSGFAADVADIVKSEGPNSIYSAVVSSQFDADRLDYMQRDRMMTGTQHAAIDFEWLIANIEIGEVEYGVDDTPVGKLETFVLGPKAVLAAEAYVWGLFQLYPTVYLHKTTRGVELLFSELIQRVFYLVIDGSVRKTGLPNKHPLVQFAKYPSELSSALALDDTVVWGALQLLGSAQDTCIAEAAQRIGKRDLYKSIDVREKIRIKLGIESSTDTHSLVVLNWACESVSRKVRGRQNALSKGRPDQLSRMLWDTDEREPYRRFQESKGPLNQIRIKQSRDGDFVDLGLRSKIVNSIESFKLDRVYVSRDDDDSREFIEKIIGEEVANARKKIKK